MRLINSNPINKLLKVGSLTVKKCVLKHIFKHSFKTRIIKITNFSPNSGGDTISAFNRLYDQ